MPTFRLSVLYGQSQIVTIDEDIVALESFRKTVKSTLSPYRNLNDYVYVVSGKPPHKLNLNNEEEFNQHRTLITNGCYVWMKLI